MDATRTPNKNAMDWNCKQHVLSGKTYLYVTFENGYFEEISGKLGANTPAKCSQYTTSKWEDKDEGVLMCYTHVDKFNCHPLFLLNME